MKRTRSQHYQQRVTQDKEIAHKSESLERTFTGLKNPVTRANSRTRRQYDSALSSKCSSTSTATLSDSRSYSARLPSFLKFFLDDEEKTVIEECSRAQKNRSKRSKRKPDASDGSENDREKFKFRASGKTTENQRTCEFVTLHSRRDESKQFKYPCFLESQLAIKDKFAKMIIDHVMLSPPPPQATSTF